MPAKKMTASKKNKSRKTPVKKEVLQPEHDLETQESLVQEEQQTEKPEETLATQDAIINQPIENNADELTPATEPQTPEVQSESLESDVSPSEKVDDFTEGDLNSSETNLEDLEDNAVDGDNQKGNKLFYFAILGVALIILSVIGFVLFKIRDDQINRDLSSRQEESVNQSPQTPEPTQPPVLARNKYGFEVLNGSGIRGAAKTIADKLESLGYLVLETGNADSSNYQKTELYLSKDLLENEALINDLKKELGIASVSGELDEDDTDSTASARIIVGQD